MMLLKVMQHCNIELKKKKLIAAPFAERRGELSVLYGMDPELSYAAFERNCEKFLRFNRKLHGELVDDFFGITSYDEINRIFHRDAALLAVEKLVFRNL